MADICMCADESCKRKLKCHRFTAHASSWQSRFTESPREGKKCEYFWSNKGCSDKIPGKDAIKRPAVLCY